MAVKKLDDYKSMNYRSFPSERSDQHRNKDEEWAIQWLSSCLHKYLNHSGTELKFDSEYLNTLEKYAKGEQGNRKVKEKLLRKDRETGKFKGRMKDVFQTLDILPEMIDVILANNMKADYTAQSLAIDEHSVKDKNLDVEMSKFLVEKETQEFLNFMGVKVDSQLSQEELATFTSAQVEVLYKSGGIQLAREKASVSVCNSAMLYSRHKEIENKNSFDSITYGICATKNYWDYKQNVPMYRYVNVKNLVIPSSEYNDFRDKTYCGEIRFMTLAEVMSETKDISSETITDLIYTNASHNKDFTANIADIQKYSEGRNSIFDEFRILTLDMVWLATDEEKFFQSRTSNDRIIYKKTDKDIKLKPSDKAKGKEFNKSAVIRKYNALWVIGTDILLNFGPSSNVTYTGPKGAKIPTLEYNVVKTGKKSLVDRCRTIVDDINLNSVKLRSAIATLPPAPRMIVYEHAVSNIKFNKIVQDPRDLFSGFSEDGVMVVNARDSNGKFIDSNGGKAVDFMGSGIGEDIAIFSNEIVNKINLLRQVLGLPEGLDGTAGQKYQLASTMNLASMASSNALYPTLSLIGPLYEQTFNNAILMTQSMCKSKDVTIKDINLAENTVNVLTLTKEFSNYEFKIKVVLSPTEAEREMLMAQLQEMSVLYSQSQGSLGCSQAEHLMLYKLIKAGLIDEAMSRIAIIEELRMRANIQQQKDSIDYNIKQQSESNASAEQQKRETISYIEAEKRKTSELQTMMEGIISMQKQILENQNGKKPENNIGNPENVSNLANVFLNENKQYVSNIKEQDDQVLGDQPENQNNELQSLQ